MDELPLLYQVARCVAYITCIAQVTTYIQICKQDIAA